MEANLLAALQTGCALAVVLGLAGLGLLINEKVGIVNLGAEGMLLLAAYAAHYSYTASGSLVLALISATASAMALGLLFGVLCLFFNSSHYASSLGVGLLGLGLASHWGAQSSEQEFSASPALAYGAAPLLVIALGLGLHYFYKRSSIGRTLVAIGDAPHAALAQGIRVQCWRMVCVLAGAALCGMAGAALLMLYSSGWNDNLVGGRGWLALTLTGFATWQPLRVLLGLAVWGLVRALAFYLELQHGWQLPPELLTSLPYIAILLVLIALTRDGAWVQKSMPQSIGKTL